MPVIINELIIRATVNDSAATSQSSGSSSSSQNTNDREAIIAQCVEQILEILEKKKER
jgi:hypothetical protein